ncbi:MAG: uroporphyrinogen-III C-methyltransferase [Corynebacterium sp.]|uniref:uroporphyrinogen-III C-methyltransferase n=1 Tax=Corynebacterium sp. TaxID=1720 RepID=UPI003F962B27
MTGLDVQDRLVVLVGGGDVTARRAERLHAEGAVLRIVAPDVSARTAALLENTQGTTDGAERTEWLPREFREHDVEGAWLVHTATGEPEVDLAVDDACRRRRIWCIDAGDAADASRGSARMAAEARQGDLAVGAVSTGAPDPRRSARVRGAVQDLLDHGLLPTRRVRSPEQGHVSLIGGGPGPEDLLTLRGHRLLLEADVIIHDRLGPTGVLAAVDDRVEVIDVGKAPGKHPVPQDEINRIIVDRASRGLRVARLKGGDPFVFGRGGEEVRECTAAGVPVDVVPGVSSAIAAPQAADVPVTHRGVADTVHVVNGHRARDSSLSPSTLAALQDDAATVVVLMGVSTLPRFAADALGAGAPGERPVAIIENAHRPEQRCVRATLETVADTAVRESVRNPAVIVVGETARPGLLAGASTAAAVPGTAGVPA